MVWLVGGVPLAEPSWGRATTQVEGRMRLTLMIVTKGRLEGSSPSLRANLLDVALHLWRPFVSTRLSTEAKSVSLTIKAV